jgi:hypothetical protein
MTSMGVVSGFISVMRRSSVDLSISLVLEVVDRRQKSRQSLAAWGKFAVRLVLDRTHPSGCQRASAAKIPIRKAGAEKVHAVVCN